MKPQSSTEVGKEDTERRKDLSGAQRASKITLCVLILNSDFCLWFHENRSTYFSYFMKIGHGMTCPCAT